MANTKSAKKRARQTPKKTAINNQVRSRVKSALRNAREALTTQGKDSADLLKVAISGLSKAANKGVIHKKNASRKISRLMKLLGKAPVVAAATTKKTPAKKNTKAKTATKAKA